MFTFYDYMTIFNSYQKTESVVKTTAEKATTIFGGFGSGLSTKLGQIKNSESFRSFEEKVGSALENVKVLISITDWAQLCKNWINYVTF